MYQIKKQVVDAQARETHKVFKVDIPNHVHRNETRGIGKLKKAERHFDEVSAFPQARPANKVNTFLSNNILLLDKWEF